MNFSKILAGICAALFFMIGADKFLNFMEPPCSLMDTFSPVVWKSIGVLQLLGGVLILMPKFRRPVAIFFTVFMISFTIYHLSQKTYDVGGAVFMAAQLGLLAWSPKFLGGQQKSSS